MNNNIFNDSNINTSSLAVYLTLCTISNDKGNAEISRKRLSSLTKMCSATLDRCIKTLKDCGYIKVTNQFKTIDPFTGLFVDDFLKKQKFANMYHII